MNFIRTLTTCISLGALACAATIASAQSVVDKESKSLIVLFRNDGSATNLDPAVVLQTVAAITEGSPNADAALYARLGSPASGQWLISERLPDVALADLSKTDANHPQARLQDYIVLSYPDSASRITAESQLVKDIAVSSVRPDTAVSLSFRPNDPYAAQLSPAYAPDNYPWALESLNAMSPYSNPTATSGWDNAKGYGFVGVVDNGVDTSHPDLQSKVRFHFSQALYQPGCTGSLTDIDERGASSNCPDTYVGHGTHVAGLIGAVVNAG